MNKKLLPILLIFLVSVIFFYPVLNVNAEDTDNDASEDLENLQEKIKKYEDKIEDLQNEAQTLSREIASADTQINLTALKVQNSIYNITKTENAIQKLSGDIDNLSERIDILIDRIDYQRDVLSERIRERYKTRETTPIMVLFGTSTVNNLVKKASYLKVMEVQDNKVLGQMNDTKDTYNRQKTLYIEKKAEEEALRVQLIQEKANLDAYKNQLEDQKNQKKRLLDTTQNDESKYQKLLADAKKELQQIIGAVSVLKNHGATKVEQGDVIGYQGNTGYSFGDHLHFGVYRYSSFEDIDGWNWYYDDYVDPAKKLKNKTVRWDDGCSSPTQKSVGKGDWSWPISNPTVSQGFGHTCWSDAYYGGNDHPAYDMYGSYATPVYAVDDGDAYFCNNCLGDGAHGVFIFHDDDYMTIYWHLQ